MKAGKQAKAVRRNAKKDQIRKIGILAEAVILQSIEDLWSKTHRKRSIEFLLGEGFDLCAETAGMKVIERLRLFRLLRRLDGELFDTKHARKIGRALRSKGMN